MNELTKNIARVGRHKALLFLILLVALAAAADRYCLQDNQVVVDSNQMLAAGLPSPDEDSGNKAGTSSPSDHGAAAQLVQFVLQEDNAPDRAKLRDRTCGKSLFRTSIESQVGAVRTTAPMIDSRLGRQFTLVGAKPSGTS